MMPFLAAPARTKPVQGAAIQSDQSIIALPDVPPPPAQLDGDESLPSKFWEAGTEALLRRAAGYNYHIQMDFFFESRRSVVMGGKAGPTHPHSFRLQLRCRGKQVDLDDHVVVPFHAVRLQAQKVIDAYNNRLLNSLPPFQVVQPTTENLVAIIYHQLEQAMAGLPIEARGVTLWESPTKAISYDKTG